ncbi:hypothetical protein [Sulfuricurvum sp.]|uniref:hypothetical protein n=1 Tax=Sulfuricurvum sp. TaxID=2025608 RepID=UPI002624548B|nr:hypothetical protein [Sulfuricurvum sp.]MDD2780630.1 hypothetical protein [Sulfuricurvum sp.]
MTSLLNSSELAFNLTQMAGTLSLVLAETNREEIVEQIQLFDSEIQYEVIQYGEKAKFETLLRERNRSLLVDLTAIDQPKSFLDVLVQLRDKLDDEHRLILLGNQAIYKMINQDFEQLKGYGLEVFTLFPDEDERSKIIQSFEEKYGMRSDTFLELWRAGELDDTEEYNRWYVLL